MTDASVINDRYRILRHLGEGGMGVVHVAYDMATEREVAIKQVRMTTVEDPERAGRRFTQEMRATTRIASPHIVSVYDFGVSDDDSLFLVMELLSGHTLTRAIKKRGAMAPKTVVHIGRQIAKALHAAFQEGVIHRDLKPDNIMLLDLPGDPDFVKVLDFGIALLNDEEGDAARHTRTGMIVGSPGYISPEQALGKPMSATSDLYSLGAVLFHAVTGRLPFSGTGVSMAVAHAHTPPPNPRELVPLMPQALATLILDMMAKSPTDRPQSGLEVARRLDAIRFDGPAPSNGTTDLRRVDTPKADEPSPEATQLLAIATPSRAKQRASTAPVIGVAPIQTAPVGATEMVARQRAPRAEEPAAMSMRRKGWMLALGAAAFLAVALLAYGAGSLQGEGTKTDGVVADAASVKATPKASIIASPGLDAPKIVTPAAPIPAEVAAPTPAPAGATAKAPVIEAAPTVPNPERAKQPRAKAPSKPSAKRQAGAAATGPSAKEAKEADSVPMVIDESQVPEAVSIGFTSQPTGAEVWVDGALLCRTPCSESAPINTVMRATIKAKGYLSATRTKSVGTRPTSVFTKLKRKSAPARVKAVAPRTTRPPSTKTPPKALGGSVPGAVDD